MPFCPFTLFSSWYVTKKRRAHACTTIILNPNGPNCGLSVCGLKNETCTSGEQSGFLKSAKKQVVAGQKLLISSREKILKEFLDVAIMAEMAQRNAISELAIIAFLGKNYNVQISPVTIYPILYKLEMKGNIKQLPKKTKKLYVLTDSGKKALDSFQREIDEVRHFITDLINK